MSLQAGAILRARSFLEAELSRPVAAAAAAAAAAGAAAAALGARSAQPATACNASCPPTTSASVVSLQAALQANIRSAVKDGLQSTLQTGVLSQAQTAEMDKLATALTAQLIASLHAMTACEQEGKCSTSEFGGIQSDKVARAALESAQAGQERAIANCPRDCFGSCFDVLFGGCCPSCRTKCERVTDCLCCGLRMRPEYVLQIRATT